MSPRRAKPIPVTLLPEEIALLDAHAHALNLTRHALMRAVVLRAREVVPDASALRAEEVRRSHPRRDS